MKCRSLYFASVFIFIFLSSLAITVITYSQRVRPQEKRGTPKCTIQVESSGRRTAFLDCTDWGTLNSTQVCTPTHPALQTKQHFETFPPNRQNCSFDSRNSCLNDNNAAYSWNCDDNQEPIGGTETQSIVCPVSCTKYCPTPDRSKPCNRATWDTVYCEWKITNCTDLGENFCTTPGWDGTCPPSTSPDGNGMCCSSGSCTNGGAVAACYMHGFEWDFDTCSCSGGCGLGGGCSPIVIDTLGNGFAMTNANNGVLFDMDGFGTPIQLAWTKADSDDAWLVLDRNHNGTVDSGEELFGNLTPQPWPPPGEEANGFLALAEYDKESNGGNQDGKINQQDSIFDQLRLWQDKNHNGISESNELYSLPQLGLRKIDLDYRESARVDGHGNQFKYRARVRDAQDAQMGRWAWDVYLVVQH